MLHSRARSLHTASAIVSIWVSGTGCRLTVVCVGSRELELDFCCLTAELLGELSHCVFPMIQSICIVSNPLDTCHSCSLASLSGLDVGRALWQYMSGGVCHVTPQKSVPVHSNITFGFASALIDCSLLAVGGMSTQDISLDVLTSAQLLGLMQTIYYMLPCLV